MPYKSDAQRKFMHAEHPEIASKWDKEYPDQGDLPDKKTKHAVKGLKKAKPKDKEKE